MTNNKYLDYAVGLLTITFFLLYIGKGAQITWGTVASLFGILVIAFLFPFVGLWLAIPIFVLVWFRHSGTLFAFLKTLQSKQVDLQKYGGGSASGTTGTTRTF
jgi:hypothetical protein